MTKQELKQVASYVLVLMLGRRPYSDAEIYFHEIRHYMGADDREIGMIAFEGSQHESILIFDEPREWHPSFLGKYQRRSILRHDEK